MTRLLEVRDELRDLDAEMARLERVVAENPAEEALSLDAGSLSKRKRHLEDEFRVLAGSLGLDAVRYRLIPEATQNVPLRALAKSLDRFQEAITTFYDARKNGKKSRPKFSADVRAQTNFDFAYTYSGSLGVVLTIPKERVLFDSDLDQSVEDFFTAIQATTREQVIGIAREYGVPAVRRLYEWSAAHADFGMSVDINWLRSAKSLKRVEAAPESLKILKEIIEETSEQDDDRVTLRGVLHGLDDDDREFHLTTLQGDIKGKWGPHFAYSPSFTLSEVYEADLVKKTKIHYAIDKEEVDWSLIALRKIDIEDA